MSPLAAAVWASAEGAEGTGCHGESEDRLGPEAVDALPGDPVTGESADEGQGHDEEDSTFPEVSRGLEIRHDERREAAIGDRPGGVHFEQSTEGWMVGHRSPWNGAAATVLFFGYGDVRDAAQEEERDEPGCTAEEEHHGELPGIGRIAEHEGGEDEGGDAAALGPGDPPAGARGRV